VADVLRGGGLALLPTDTMYVLAALPGNRDAIERMRQIKCLTTLKYLTLLCRSLSESSHYALIDDEAFKLMRQLTPGPFTFLLTASKAVPKAVLNPKRREVGLRIPDHAVMQMLLGELDGVLVTTSARLPDGEPATYHYELFDALNHLVDVIVDDERDMLDERPSTIIDMTGQPFRIVREGGGLDRLANLLIPEPAE
jgi:tRNA threonylcarbamoyl adenosine modification protein (Sua5/YciO/YrdC/YwlC family)